VLAGSNRIKMITAGIRSFWPDPANTCSPESGNGNQTLPDSCDSYIFAFRNFFLRAKRWKIFSRKSFFF
jgi:hypothetical protein